MQKNQKLPNFLIVGAARCGTTSLYHYLNEHPNIFLPSKKECRFFSQMNGNFQGPGDRIVNKTIVKSVDQYSKHFKPSLNIKAKGDVSPDYLYYFESSIPNIKKLLDKEVKIIIILRNPINRAFSQYKFFKRNFREKLKFFDALTCEEERKDKNWEWAWRYKEVGLYYKQVRAYLDQFENTKILFFKDLKNLTFETAQSIYEFLEVDSSFIPRSINSTYNKSFVFNNKLSWSIYNGLSLLSKSLNQGSAFSKSIQNKLLPCLEQNFTKTLIMDHETKDFLKDYYQEDIRKLNKLLNKDLSYWLEI